MMKKIIAIAVMSFMLVTSAFAENIDIRLEGLTSVEQSVDVIFKEFSPVSDNGILMAPVRAVCEQAGMKVMWQSLNGAVIIKIESEGTAPINEYAKALLCKNSTLYMKPLVPRCIYMTMYLNSYEAMLHYNYEDMSGNTVSYGKIFNLNKTVKIEDDGTLTAPLRNVFNELGLWVLWDDENRTANITIPEFINAPVRLGAIETYDPEYIPEIKEVKSSEVVETVKKQEPPADILQKYSSQTASQSSQNDKGTYLGNFKITHYCACEKCCGAYGGNTAWGGPLKPGYSIAVDPAVIGKLEKVYIDGYGYRVAEDCGGAIKGNRIDIAVSSHEEALQLGVVYKDVWLAE